MTDGCRQEDCTIVETGVCLLDYSPADCPHRDYGIDALSSPGGGQESIPLLKEPERQPQFPPSRPLTPTQIRDIMGKRYFHLVGIVGIPDAGKTACLVSLYLLLSKGRLDGFSFADSRTLMAFEQISQGARQWNEGRLPEELTTHTELADDRTAGFLHLMLLPAGFKEPVDLLFPDLPGEWTTALVNDNRSERFEFLKRADVVWLMVNGEQLFESSTRQFALHRTKLLIQRLGELLEETANLMFVVTRRDRAEPNQATIDDLCNEALARGLCPGVVMIASVSENNAIAPGFGIAQLVAASTSRLERGPAFWPDHNSPQGGRAMTGFRMR